MKQEYEKLTGARLKEKYVCPGYPECENMDCDCEGPETEDEDVKEDEEEKGARRAEEEEEPPAVGPRLLQRPTMNGGRR